MVDQVDELFAVRARRGVDDDEIGIARSMSKATFIAGNAVNLRAVFRSSCQPVQA